MPGLEEIEHYLHGIWRLMRNRADGFQWLDTSADGFWRSFWAIPYAVPALAVSWASYRALFLQTSEAADAGVGFVLRLALIDVASWIVPLVIVALAARTLGIERHFARFVVATNWLGALTAYALALPSLLRLVLSDTSIVIALVSLGVFILTIVLLYRVTRLSFEGDAMNAAIVTVGMILFSILLTGLLQHALGVALP